MKNSICIILIMLMSVLAFCGCTPAETPTEAPTASVTAPQQTTAGIATATPEPTKTVEYTETTLLASEIPDKVKLTGRNLITPDSIGLDWSYSGLELSGYFDGDITVSYTVTGNYSAYISVWVDGDTESVIRTEVTAGSGSMVIANVERGYHTVNMIKSSDSTTGLLSITALSFVGQIDEKPADGKLKIEFIGDSITCGYGVLTTAEDYDWMRYPEYEDAFYSYAAVLARSLDADVNLIAIPGWGMVIGGTSRESVIPPIYEYTDKPRVSTQEWDFSAWQPDVVVLALGTNDFMLADTADGKAEFEVAYGAFLQTVRKNNPDALIICMYGMMGTPLVKEIRSAIQQQNDDKIIYLGTSSSWDAGGGHPTLKFHEVYAHMLEGRIEKYLG